MHSLSLSSRKALSPKGLPKISHGKIQKLHRDHSTDLNTMISSPSNHLFVELEKKLLEQQKEITSRDSEVKKVISKFESIAEAHKDQKDKYSRITEKYFRAKKELTIMNQTNERLKEMLNKSPDKFHKEYEQVIAGLKQEIEIKKKTLHEKQSIILRLEAENDSVKREMFKQISQNKLIKDELAAQHSQPDLKILQEKYSDLEKELKVKQDELQNATNQNLFFKEQINAMEVELKTAKNSVLTLKRSQFIQSQSKTEEFLRLEAMKIEDYVKKIQSLKSVEEVHSNKIEKLKEKQKKLKRELEQSKLSSVKIKEKEALLVERTRYLEKELTSQKEISSAYKKKFEELSVEMGLVSETIKYKDEKIKRESERIKSLKFAEAENVMIKRSCADLEELLKHQQAKNEKIIENMIREKEKYLIKEVGLMKTIEAISSDKHLSIAEITQLFKFHEEIKALKQEVEDCKAREQSLNEVNENLEKNIRKFRAAFDSVKNALKCRSCNNEASSFLLISPCHHIICKNCYGGQCIECFLPISNIGQIEFLDNLAKVFLKFKDQL